MPSRDSAERIISRVLEGMLDHDHAEHLARQAVEALDKAAADAAPVYEPRDIVQIKPHVEGWAGALMTVTEVRPWGVIGFVQVPKGGRAFRRCEFSEVEQTGGVAPFLPEHMVGRDATAAGDGEAA